MASKQPVVKNKGEKRKRVVLTLKEKIDICTRLEKGENRKALMQEYNVGMSTLYDIKAHKGQLLRFFANSDSNKALEHRRTLHTPKLEHLDRVLYEWFLVKRSEGVPVSGPMLIEKAKDFYEQMQLTEPCVFSGGWLWRFKARHGIKKLDVSNERQSADHQAAEQFCGFFRSLIAEHGLSPEQFYNADETGLFWRCLPNSTPEGASASGLKQTKDRLTVLMCANAAGSHKIKPLVIGKCNGPRTFKGIQHLPVAYKAQGNAWMDKEIFSDWFHHIFVPSVKDHFRNIGLPDDSKAILLLDNSRAHPQEAELVSDNIFTIFLPASVTSLIQPMDQGIRRDFMRNFINPPVTVQDLQTRYNISDAIFNVACAWNSVTSEILRRAWRKLWPSVMFAEVSSDEEELDRFRVRPPNNTLVQILEMVKDPPSPPVNKLNKSEGDEWADADQEGEVSQGVSDTEIVETVWNPDNGTDSEKDSDGEDFREGEKTSWEKAASSFDSIISFAEKQPCFTNQEIMQLHMLHAIFMRQRQMANKQTEIRDIVKIENPRGYPGICTDSAQSPIPSTSTALYSDN
ncbi:jerky protein homolog [Trichosurus vulpecula]|uniref:jerky protein homolog n=1 Tax=Trichosurus vulpecula TaxID=9337 RepID=UPI00186AF8B6|nr:jerky protein homolog [Trichosurus vulpecula]